MDKSKREDFIAAIQKARAALGERGLSVSLPEAAEGEFFLGDDGKEGFAIVGNDLRHVFRAPGAAKGTFGRALEEACKVLAAAGHKEVTLDCFAPLAAHYGRHGFTETGRLKFDPAYAPEGWTAAMGAPDVVLMVRRLT